MPDRLFRKRLSERDPRILPKAEPHLLDAVKRVAEPQRHFKGSTWMLPGTAASGAEPELACTRDDANARRILWT